MRLPMVPGMRGRIRIVGETIFDGIHDDPLENGEIEIIDGVISYVGRYRKDFDQSVSVVDVHGGYVTPGFVDVHVHLTMPNDVSPLAMRRWFPEESVFSTADTMKLTLDGGVTAIRDLSGLTPGFRNAIARGWIPGPRCHMSVTYMSPTGGHADPVAPNGVLALDAEHEWIPTSTVVDADNEIVKAVRRYDRIGADVFKVCTSGGVSTPDDSPDMLGMNRNQVALVVATARLLHDQPVAAHAQSAAGVREAVYGGASTIEHAYDLDDELIKEILRRRITIVPTLSVFHYMPSCMSDETRRYRAKRCKVAMACIGRAIKAGVQIAAGTDSGISRQGENLKELGYLVDAGMTPMQAIRAATSVGAKTMKLDQWIGSIEVGKQADLVLLSVDPVGHIHDLWDHSLIRGVWQSGRMVKDLDDVEA